MADKKKDAIFRMEKKDGKLYRVMYYKNSKGGFTRSKFIREVTKKEKVPKSKKKAKTSKPKTLTKKQREARINAILQKKQEIQAEQVRRQQVQQAQQKQTQHSHKSNYKKGHPHMHKVVTPTSRFKSPQQNGYVKRSGSTDNLINKWKNLAKK